LSGVECETIGFGLLDELATLLVIHFGGANGRFEHLDSFGMNEGVTCL
jgi:hypothetical protein